MSVKHVLCVHCAKHIINARCLPFSVKICDCIGELNGMKWKYTMFLVIQRCHFIEHNRLNHLRIPMSIRNVLILPYLTSYSIAFSPSLVFPFTHSLSLLLTHNLLSTSVSISIALCLTHRQKYTETHTQKPPHLWKLQSYLITSEQNVHSNHSINLLKAMATSNVRTLLKNMS